MDRLTQIEQLRLHIMCDFSEPCLDTLIDEIEALEAQVAAADALARHASAQLAYMDLCDDKGDFERNLRAALAAYNEAKKGPTE